MTTITRTWGRGPASSGQRRQLILLAVLGVVLALLLVWQLPKLIGGSGSSSEATATTASEVAPTAVAASAPTGVQTGSAAAQTSAAAAAHRALDQAPPGAGSLRAAGRQRAGRADNDARGGDACGDPGGEARRAGGSHERRRPGRSSAPEIVPRGDGWCDEDAREVRPCTRSSQGGGWWCGCGWQEAGEGGGCPRPLVRAEPGSQPGQRKQLSLERRHRHALYSVVFRSATNQTPTTTTTTTRTVGAHHDTTPGRRADDIQMSTARHDRTPGGCRYRAGSRTRCWRRSSARRCRSRAVRPPPSVPPKPTGLAFQLTLGDASGPRRASPASEGATSRTPSFAWFPCGRPLVELSTRDRFRRGPTRSSGRPRR